MLHAERSASGSEDYITSVHMLAEYVCQCAKSVFYIRSHLSRELSVSTRAHTHVFTFIYLAVDLQHFVAVIALAYQCVCACVSRAHSSLSSTPLSLALALSLLSSFGIENKFRKIFAIVYLFTACPACTMAMVNSLIYLLSHCACNPLMQFARP